MGFPVHQVANKGFCPATRCEEWNLGTHVMTHERSNYKTFSQAIVRACPERKFHLPDPMAT